MYTEATWNIWLDYTRKASHDVEIKIFDYASPPSTISLHFESHLQISDPQLKTKGKSVIGQQSQIPQSGPKIFSWLVNEIVNAYGGNVPNPLPARINFSEENRILQFPDISIVNLHYGCGDLWARSVEVFVHLPKLGVRRYVFDWLILTIFRKKRPTGVYEIEKGKGSHDWDIIKKGRSPVLKFINTTHSSFPLASFSFRRAAKPINHIFTAFISFILGILTHMFGSYLYERFFR